MAKEVKVTPEQLIAVYQNQRALLDSIRQQTQTMQAYLQEVVMASDALKEISESSEKNRVLFSVGAGMFIDVQLLDNNNVKSDIGGGAFKEVSIKKAMNMLDDRAEEIKKALKKLSLQEKKAIASLKQIEEALAKFQQSLQQESVNKGVS